MSFLFQHTNDYDILIPWEKQREGRDFAALIDSYFPNQNDLLFCLLEMVTLSDLDAIGETYLYSIYSKSEGKEVLSQYRSIVNNVISKYKFSIAEYLDWYKRHTYILIRSNKTTYDVPHQTPDWEQEPSTIESQHDRSKFGKQLESCLHENQIQDYLQYYAKLLHENFDFKKYPNYCIIIRPISVCEGKEVIPLGNLYLHFATLVEKDSKFYFRLINDFLIVWFRKKGVRIIKEIQKKTIQEQTHKNNSYKDYLPNFSVLLHPGAHSRLSRKLKNSDLSLEDYYDLIFANDQYRNALCEKLGKLKELIIPKFSKLVVSIKAKENQDHPNFTDLSESLGYSDKFFGIQGQRCLESNVNVSHFEKILIRRELFKIGLLLFDIDKDTLRTILLKGYYDDLQFSVESDYTALWNEMFIPWSKNEKSSDKTIKIIIEKSLSSFEKNFLMECKEYKSAIETSLPNFE